MAEETGSKGSKNDIHSDGGNEYNTDSSTKEREVVAGDDLEVRMELTLEDVLKLLEVDELPVEKGFWTEKVVDWTNRLVERNGEDWVKQNRKRLLAELHEL